MERFAAVRSHPVQPLRNDRSIGAHPQDVLQLIMLRALPGGLRTST
jgi:hypothetical protein